MIKLDTTKVYYLGKLKRMREIKFRRSHFDENNNFMYFTYWGFLNHKDEFDCKCFKSPNNSNKSRSHKDEQYTGLKDKNGIEIYEGDILKSNSYNKTWIVDFTPCDGLKLAIKYDSEFENSGIVQTHEEWRYNKASTCEIIGNIHNK